jgi:hypothetical protein
VNEMRTNFKPLRLGVPRIGHPKLFHEWRPARSTGNTMARINGDGALRQPAFDDCGARYCTGPKTS